MTFCIKTASLVICWPIAWTGWQPSPAKSGGRYTRRAFGAAETQWQASGALRYALERQAFEDDLVSARAQVDPDTFAMALAEGREMSTEQAMAYALDETDARDSGIRNGSHRDEHD